MLNRIVLSFDAPDSPEVVDFWQKFAQSEDCMSGGHCLTGWITAFCLWNEQGKQLRPPGHDWYKHGSVCCLDEAKYHSVDTSKIPNGLNSVPVIVNDNGTEFQTTMIAGSGGMKVFKSKSTNVNSESIKQDDTTDPLLKPDLNENYSTKSDASSEFVVQIPQLESAASTDLDALQPVLGWWMFERTEEDLKAFPQGYSKEDDMNLPERLFAPPRPVKPIRSSKRFQFLRRLKTFVLCA